MAGRVIVVDRGRRLDGIERLYLPMIFRGLWVTARHFFRNLRGFVTGRRRSDFVVQYPEERVEFPPAFRGMPVLIALPDGEPRCVACGLCEVACPARCIHIDPAELEGAAIERYPERFEIDMSRCMFCGLCEEACPEEAIAMSQHVELAGFERADLVFGKEELLVSPDLLARRIDFLREGYERPPAGRQGALGGERA